MSHHSDTEDCGLNKCHPKAEDPHFHPRPLRTALRRFSRGRQPTGLCQNRTIERHSCAEKKIKTSGTGNKHTSLWGLFCYVARLLLFVWCGKNMCGLVLHRTPRPIYFHDISLPDTSRVHVVGPNVTSLLEQKAIGCVLGLM